LNQFITISALVVGAAQLIFLYNLIVSYRNGKESGNNPWESTTLEWQTPTTPPPHGNFGPDLPLVYRWAYDYSVPGAESDFLPQNLPPQGASAEGIKEA
jgi:cytochrome c oxidase subunit 1